MSDRIDVKVTLYNSGFGITRLNDIDGDEVQHIEYEHDGNGDINAEISNDNLNDFLNDNDYTSVNEYTQVLTYYDNNYTFGRTWISYHNKKITLRLEVCEHSGEYIELFGDIGMLNEYNIMRQNVHQTVMKELLSGMTTKDKEKFVATTENLLFNDAYGVLRKLATDGYDISVFKKIKSTYYNFREGSKRHNVEFVEGGHPRTGDIITKCSQCRTIAYADDMQEHENYSGNICESCMDDMRECHECGYESFSDDGYYGCNEWYCSSDCCHDAGDCDCCHEDDGSDEYWNSELGSMDITSNDNTYDLVTKRYYGVEIETCDFAGFPNYVVREYFSGVPDGSISGTELVSNKLCGDKGLDIITDVMDEIKANNSAATDSSCGYHLQVDVSDLSKTHIRELYKFCKANETLFFSMFHENRRANSYCRSINSYPKEKQKYALSTATRDSMIASIVKADVRNFVKSGGGTISPRHEAWGGRQLDGISEAEAGSEVARVAKRVKYSYDTRYVWANFVSVLRQNSFEIRTHSQTLNGDKIGKWVRLWTHIVDGIRYGYIKGRQHNLADLIAKFKTSNDNKKVMLKEYAARIKKYKRSDAERTGYLGTKYSENIQTYLREALEIPSNVIELPITMEELSSAVLNTRSYANSEAICEAYGAGSITTREALDLLRRFE
jgi:hypothetical protein